MLELLVPGRELLDETVLSLKTCADLTTGEGILLASSCPDVPDCGRERPSCLLAETRGFVLAVGEFMLETVDTLGIARGGGT